MNDISKPGRKKSLAELVDTTSKKLAAMSLSAEELLGAWCNALSFDGRTEQTISTYQAQIAKFLDWFKENAAEEDLRRIMAIDILAYRRYLQEEGFKPATINTALTALSALCHWMADEGFIKENPMVEDQRLAQQQIGPRRLTKSEEFRVIQTVQKGHSRRNEAIILCILMAGLRAVEVANLKPKALIITPKEAAINVTGIPGKHRIVPITQALARTLGRYALEKRISAEWLFPSQRGDKLTIRAVRHLCAAIGEKAGVEQLNPQVLRNTYCYKLINRGIDRGTVAVLIGNSQLNPNISKPNVDLQAAVAKLNYD